MTAAHPSPSSPGNKHPIPPEGSAPAPPHPGNAPARDALPDLDALFAPRSVAIIGASADASVISGRPQRILAQHGYAGAVYPVNPRYEQIDGLGCYPDIGAVPGPVDVAVVAVAARRVPQVLAGCAAAGVRFAVVVSSGFAEQAGAGRLQEELESVLAACPGLRVLGPNSEGLIATAGPVPLGFSPAIDYSRGLAELIAGGVAVVAQSGGLGFALLNDGLSRGLGFSHVVSTGNEADLDLLDITAYLLEQPPVRVLLLFIEGLRDGRRLHAVAARARELGKPLIAAKVGRSAAARRAALSHTAHLAGHDAAYDAVLRHYGALRAGDQEELVDLALAFARCPLPAGRRIAVVTLSGGAGTWMADALDAEGLAVPALSEALQARLRPLIPAYGSAANPVDVTAQVIATAGGISPVLETLAASGEADAIVLVTTLADTGQLGRERDQLARVLAGTSVPLLIYSYTRPSPGSISLLAGLRVPYYTSSRRAARALAALCRYAAGPGPASPAGRTAPPPQVPADGGTPGQPAPGWPASEDAALVPPGGARLFPPGRRMLTEPQAKQLLRRWGLPVPDGITTATPAGVADAAARLARPVAVKAICPGLAHKSDAGAVVLGVTTPQAAAAAAERIAASLAGTPGAHLEGFLVEAMAPPGIEMIIGARTDPDLGPLVLVGRGGLDAETWHDTALAPAPISPAQAARLIRRLRSAPLLSGTRGRPPADTGALARCLARLSQLITAHASQVAELDCNPVLVHEDGHGCTIADAMAVSALHRC
ncbi:MAG TPA: acetate--CoA ligase family protein [Streptosporangiaceae bacterium]|nr:acetate--CoA ligase family protein [Streptosporangiaceae bacterium]